MFSLVIFSSLIPRTEIFTTVVERVTAGVIKLQLTSVSPQKVFKCGGSEMLLAAFSKSYL